MPAVSELPQTVCTGNFAAFNRKTIFLRKIKKSAVYRRPAHQTKNIRVLLKCSKSYKRFLQNIKKTIQ
jgi:hypothetical protein